MARKKRKGRFLGLRRAQQRRLITEATFFVKYRGATGRFEKKNARKVQTPVIFQVTKRLTSDREKVLVIVRKRVVMTARRAGVTPKQMRDAVRRNLKTKRAKDNLEIRDGDVIIAYPKRRRPKPAGMQPVKKRKKARKPK